MEIDVDETDGVYVLHDDCGTWVRLDRDGTVSEVFRPRGSPIYRDGAVVNFGCDCECHAELTAAAPANAPAKVRPAVVLDNPNGSVL